MQMDMGGGRHCWHCLIRWRIRVAVAWRVEADAMALVRGSESWSGSVMRDPHTHTQSHTFSAGLCRARQPQAAGQRWDCCAWMQVRAAGTVVWEGRSSLQANATMGLGLGGDAEVHECVWVVGGCDKVSLWGEGGRHHDACSISPTHLKPHTAAAASSVRTCASWPPAAVTSPGVWACGTCDSVVFGRTSFKREHVARTARPHSTS